MSEKLVDFPAYDNDREKVPFPPYNGEAGQQKGREREILPNDYEGDSHTADSYVVDPPTPDPSLTSPGAPDLRDVGTSDIDADSLKGLSPNPDWKNVPGETRPK